jgi:hypothetical protein
MKTITKEDLESAWKAGQEQAIDQMCYDNSNSYYPSRGTMDLTFDEWYNENINEKDPEIEI